MRTNFIELTSKFSRTIKWKSTWKNAEHSKLWPTKTKRLL